MSEEVQVMPEARASLNIRFATEHGFEGLLTMRAFDEREETAKGLLAKLGMIEEVLHKKGCKPIFGRNNAKGKVVGESAGEEKVDEDVKICPIHKVKLRKWEKDGRKWYSHKVAADDAPDGEEYWCKGEE